MNLSLLFINDLWFLSPQKETVHFRTRNCWDQHWIDVLSTTAESKTVRDVNVILTFRPFLPKWMATINHVWINDFGTRFSGNRGTSIILQCQHGTKEAHVLWRRINSRFYPKSRFRGFLKHGYRNFCNIIILNTGLGDRKNCIYFFLSFRFLANQVY